MQGTSATDSQIIKLYLNRDQRAISESDAHYGAYCRRISVNILKSREDSEECVNDTWHRAWNSIPPQTPTSLSAFFGKIVRNLSISRYRKNKSKKNHEGIMLLLSDIEECVPSNDSVIQKIESKELAGIINDWLAELDKDERVLFVRRYWFGESVKDLADECGRTRNQIAQTMMALRKSLKAKLNGKGIEI
jgi:RNA polymerase sigma-70 factor (ECF subfamily)